MLLDEKHRQKLLKRGAAIEVLTLLDGSEVVLHDGKIYQLDVPKDSLKDTAKKTKKGREGENPCKTRS